MSAKLSEAEKIVSQRLQEIKEGLTTTQISELVPGLEKDEQVDLINRLMKTCAEMLKTEGSDVLTLRYRKPMPDGLKQDEQVVYSLVDDFGKNGIWIRDIRQESNLTDASIRRILKVLEQRKLVKAIKKPGTTKKQYILYNLDTGGEPTFYSDNQFDSEFVQGLIQFCVHTLKTRQKEAVEKYPYDLKAQIDFSSLKSENIAQIIHDRKVVKEGVQLSLKDIEDVLSVAVIDGKVERRSNNAYRALVHPVFISPLVSMPCYACPMRGECRPGNLISPEKCEYIKNAFEL